MKSDSKKLCMNYVSSMLDTLNVVLIFNFCKSDCNASSFLSVAQNLLTAMSCNFKFVYLPVSHA